MNFVAGSAARERAIEPGRSSIHSRTYVEPFPNTLGRSYCRLNHSRIGKKLQWWAALAQESTASQSGIEAKEQRVRLYDTPTGRYYLPTDAPRDPVIHCIKTGAIFEPEIIETAKAYFRPGSTVLDLGANFGQMSSSFRIRWFRRHVHSFEADPFLYELLQKTLAANNCQNVTAHLGAVYDRPGKQLFYPVQDFIRFGSYGSYGIDPNAKSGRTVETLNIDSLNIETPVSFMKVDIQGSDLFALRGAVETIKRHGMPIIFEFYQPFQADFAHHFRIMWTL